MSKTQEAELNASHEAKRPHREDRHSFFLLEKGTVKIEIDFNKFEITPSTVIYMHPDQVHRVVAMKDVTVSSWALNNESLNPEYVRLLENLTPARPLMLEAETFSVLTEAVSLCIKLAKRRSRKLDHAMLKDGCNALVAMVISEYLASDSPATGNSRAKIIADGFKAELESHFVNVKSPSAYAAKLNVSAPYLNECVRTATGFSVSHHIQQRIILEAKRLLYYSDKTVKEISFELGYEDYPYFSQLFTKIAGMTPLTFRNKNLE